MYIGWIPNASGFLSFSHIGGMPVRNRTYDEDLYPPTKFLEEARYLSLLQQRNLSDRPAIGPFRANPRQGRLAFLLQAELETGPTGRRLEGMVLCAPASLSQPIEQLHATAKLGHPNSLAPATVVAISALQAKLGAAFFAVKFTLDDDGVIDIQSVVNAAPTDADGPLCAFEAYSFLKDVLHKHRFHNGSDDALLELTQCTLSEKAWSERVIRNLHRSVISSFRGGSPSAQLEALGKLAYLEAFLGVLERRGIKPSPSCTTTTLRSAIEAHHGRGAHEREEKSLIWAYFLSMAAILVPVIFVCLQLLQMPCIEGLTKGESCTTTFAVPQPMLALASGVLSKLDWLLLVTALMAAAVVLTLNRKRLFAYNSERLRLATWTSDLRDLYFRFAISSRGLALTLLGLFAVGLVWGYGALAWKLLEGWSR